MDFSTTWLDAVSDVLFHGESTSPRGKLTREVPQKTIVVDMRRPVLTVPARRLSYKFMAAEAYWILSGDDQVSTIAPYNARISDFSDDGERFFGAYGPKILAQIGYVIAKLRLDEDTRQAGLTIWRECPPQTKDVPCTVAIFFSIRKNRLNTHVFMRSSDVWLGVPYDVFNFSMLGHWVCGLINKDRPELLEPGTLFLTAASSHLYQENWVAAEECLPSKVLPQPETPAALWLDPQALMLTLMELRDAGPGSPLRWWES